jgi:hypothetical protein
MTENPKIDERVEEENPTCDLTRARGDGHPVPGATAPLVKSREPFERTYWCGRSDCPQIENRFGFRWCWCVESNLRDPAQ